MRSRRSLCQRDVEPVGPCSIAVVSNAVVTDDLAATLAGFALQDAFQRRATFTRANLIASTERVLRGVSVADAGDRSAFVDRIADAAQAQAVELTPRPDDESLPAWAQTALHQQPELSRQDQARLLRCIAAWRAYSGTGEANTESWGKTPDPSDARMMRAWDAAHANLPAMTHKNTWGQGHEPFPEAALSSVAPVSINVQPQETAPALSSRPNPEVEHRDLLLDATRGRLQAGPSRE